MQFDAAIRLYKWWLESLSELMTRHRSAAETWRTLLKDTPDGLEIRTRYGTKEKLVATLPPDADHDQMSVLKSIVRKEASGAKPVLARISPADVLVRTIQIPNQASDVIGPVLGNQMERMVPWPDAETRYGYRIVGPSTELPDQIDVEVIATNKRVIDTILQRAGDIGLDPVSVDFASTDEPRASVELMSLEPKPAQKTAARLATAFAALLAACVVTTGYGVYEVWSRQSEDAAIEGEIAAVRARVAEIGKLSEENDRLREQRGRLARKKSDEPAMMILIEALSRALPDSAYLTELEIEGREVRMVGKSENATALITILEDTPQFENVRFSAPTTREPSETVETFSIVGRAQGGSSLEALQ